MSDEALPQPRYYKEANSQFLLPGGYNIYGAPPGFVLIVLGMGLSYWWLIPLGVALSWWLCKKVGQDELFLRSLLLHLLTFRGMRYLVASHREPNPRVTIFGRNREPLTAAAWLQQRIEGARDHQLRQTA